MTKSTIILVSLFWVLCATYLAVARVFNYPYQIAAMIGSWAASALLLICIIIYIQKHREKKNQKQ